MWGKQGRILIALLLLAAPTHANIDSKTKLVANVFVAAMTICSGFFQTKDLEFDAPHWVQTSGRGADVILINKNSPIFLGLVGGANPRCILKEIHEVKVETSFPDVLGRLNWKKLSEFETLDIDCFEDQIFEFLGAQSFYYFTQAYSDLTVGLWTARLYAENCSTALKYDFMRRAAGYSWPSLTLNQELKFMVLPEIGIECEESPPTNG